MKKNVFNCLIITLAFLPLFSFTAVSQEKSQLGVSEINQNEPFEFATGERQQQLSVNKFHKNVTAPEKKIEKNQVGNDSEFKKYEVGVQVTWLRQKSFNEDSPVFDINFTIGGRYVPPQDCCQTEFGFGGRFTYNFNKNLSAEIEGNFFPIDRLNPKSREARRIFGTNEFVRVFLEPQGRKLQIIAGPKAGIRKKKFGIFGKIRPGIFHVEEYPAVLELRLNLPSPGVASGRFQTTFFALDVGGVFEYYPTKRTSIRFDVGDNIIFYRALEPKAFNPGFTRHTFQFTTGFGFRF